MGGGSRGPVRDSSPTCTTVCLGVPDAAGAPTRDDDLTAGQGKRRDGGEKDEAGRTQELNWRTPGGLSSPSWSKVTHSETLGCVSGDSSPVSGTLDFPLPVNSPIKELDTPRFYIGPR